MMVCCNITKDGKQIAFRKGEVYLNYFVVRKARYIKGGET